MTTAHLHTPEMKAKAANARLLVDGGPRPPIQRSGPAGGMTVHDRMLSAKRRYEYWLARYELSVKKENERAAKVLEVAEQRAVVKHSLENRMSNMEGALNSILAHLTNGKA